MTPIRTTCPYCGVGCGVLVSRDGDGFQVRGDPEHPANLGRLCSKGSALADTLGLDGRLLHPEVRGERVDWGTALDTVATRFSQVIAEHGPDAVAFYVSGQLLTEDYYVANKLMKGFIGSGNIDTNSRLCMSSVVAAQKRAFGSDTVPVCYEDLELADLVVLVGSNAAWTHPVVYQRLVAAKKARPEMRVVVIDPRRTATCDLADLHLPIKPGTDAWLFNGLLDHLRREGGLDWAYLEAHVEGFGAALAAVAGMSIPSVATACGLAEADVADFYRGFLQTPRTVTVFSQGINQSSSGVDKGNAIINAHLATGRVGKAGAGPFSITGQPNAMGGREVGGLANQLAAHMDFTREDVARVGRFWNAPRMAQQPGLKAVEMFEAVRSGRIKAVWVMATNPAVSLPLADRVVEALRQCEFLVSSEVVAHTDTSIHAHVRLPAAAWGEKDGTVTNSERRISRQRAFLPLPGEAQPDWWIVAEVAKRMGFRDAFDYAGPAEIFREHAALSSFENASSAGWGEGKRVFDLSGLRQLGQDAYNALQAVQWPVTVNGGTPRLFADGRFHTPSGKARMAAIQPRPPARNPDEMHPFVLNTGRIRDQWHTMTRTAKAAKLLAHIDEPYVEMHPRDAGNAGVRSGDLVRVHNAHGEIRVRVRESEDQPVGSVFVPIHWNNRFTGNARVGTLVDAAIDPISGQPEFKHMPVAVAALPMNWQGFLLSRSSQSTPPVWAYWTRVPGKAATRLELADDEPAQVSIQQARLACPLPGLWMEMLDEGAGRYRGALIDGDRLQAVYFIERTADRLPPRHWLESLFEHDTLSHAERSALLLGHPGQAAGDRGPVVCACFGVGKQELLQAIAKGSDSVETLGQCLKAGTNCGSCIPELKALLQRRG